MTLSMNQLNLLGDFRMVPWVVTTPGTFNLTIDDVWLSLEAELMFTNEGTPEEGLRVGNVLQSQLTYDELHLNFDQLGFLGTVLQVTALNYNSVCSNEAEFWITRLIHSIFSIALCFANKIRSRWEIRWRNIFSVKWGQCCVLKEKKASGVCWTRFWRAYQRSILMPWMW